MTWPKSLKADSKSHRFPHLAAARSHSLPKIGRSVSGHDHWPFTDLGGREAVCCRRPAANSDFQPQKAIPIAANLPVPTRVAFSVDRDPGQSDTRVLDQGLGRLSAPSRAAASLRCLLFLWERVAAEMSLASTPRRQADCPRHCREMHLITHLIVLTCTWLGSGREVSSFMMNEAFIPAARWRHPSGIQQAIQHQG